MSPSTNAQVSHFSFLPSQVLKSVLDGSTLRINTYATSPPTATVNCARLTEVDQHTTNGVVHTVSTVLHPVTSSLAQLIKADPQFSILAKCEYLRPFTLTQACTHPLFQSLLIDYINSFFLSLSIYIIIIILFWYSDGTGQADG